RRTARERSMKRAPSFASTPRVTSESTNGERDRRAEMRELPPALHLDEKHVGRGGPDVLPDVGLIRNPHDVSRFELALLRRAIREDEPALEGREGVEDRRRMVVLVGLG